MSERLTDEQLRAVARSFTEQSIEAAAVNEALALRARVAKLEAALLVDGEKLLARNAELEATLLFLLQGTKWKSVDKDNTEFEGRITCYQLDKARAALRDAPQ